MTSQELLRTREAAKIIGFATGTLQNWRFQGLGPPYLKIRKRVFYRIKDLQNFLDKHRVDPAKGSQ